MDNLPEPISEEKKEFTVRPEPNKLDKNLRDFIDVYKKEKTMTRACSALNIDRYDIDVALVSDKNFEVCMLYAEKEIQDELEYAVMAKAGLLGDDIYNKFKKGHTPTAFNFLKSKHSGYKGRQKPTNATQINANKVTINHSRTKDTI